MIGYIQLIFIILLTIVLLCLAIVFVAAAVATVKKTSHEYKRAERLAADEERRHINEELDHQNHFDESNIREHIAQEFDLMSGNRNPDDPEGSALYSRWAMNAADRIRHPERYSGAAKGTGSD